MTTHLFVYGTLLRRSRHPMARFLADRAHYVGTASIAGRLYDLGRYPGMTPPHGDGEWVHGDLYNLGEGSTTLAELDAYEMEESPLPSYFERQTATVTLADGTLVEAWVYWFRGDVDAQRRIESGTYM